MTDQGADVGAGRPSVGDGAGSASPCPPPHRRTRQSSLFRLFLGGIVGTAALALIMLFVEPILTGQTSGLARLLGAEIGTPHGVGLVVFHFFNGSIIFPLGFAFLSSRIPGPWLVKGLIWGLILWLMTEAVIMPISGYGFFGQNAGGLSTALGALVGLLVYGGLQGAIAGLPGRKDD